MAKKRENKVSKNKMTNKKYTNKEDDFSISKIVSCILIVCFVLGCAYFLTLYLTDKGKRAEVAVPEARIQYEVILAGESFSQNEDDYVVVYYNQDDINIYSDIFSSYSEKKGKPVLYKCYTNEALNKKFVGSNENKEVKKPGDLKVKTNTLIRFSNHKVVDYITGSDEIISYLENL